MRLSWLNALLLSRLCKSFVGMVYNSIMNVIRFSCYVLSNVGTCKNLQQVICQVVPRYVAMEFLHV
jgi:hypothetical protein